MPRENQGKETKVVSEWTDEQVAVRMELGDAEVLALADKLGDYQRYDSVNTEGSELTPQQVTALAAFAKTLGPDVVIVANGLKRVRAQDERARIACQNELDRRRNEARKAAYKDMRCPDCGQVDVQAAGYGDKCPECAAVLPYYPYG
jgi:hypothetical protein